jgi:hypothetical protein
MSEWWTYTLSDFLLFSDRVYYRLFELHNRNLWPAQVLTFAIGVAFLYAMLSRTRARSVVTILGMLWLWIAWAFFWERYCSINWAAAYVAPAFALQGFAFIGAGLAGRIAFPADRSGGGVLAVALLVLSLAGYPLLAPLLGRPWSASEVFGVAPDPTAVATLAILAFARGRARWPLMLVPCLWCAVTGATLWTLGAADFFVAPLAAVAALVVARLRS